MKMRALVVLAGAVTVGGCGDTATLGSRNDHQNPLAAYKACLVAHSQDAQTACQSQKLAMEPDEFRNWD